jgi:phosphotransferase family enzyme
MRLEASGTSTARPSGGGVVVGEGVELGDAGTEAGTVVALGVATDVAVVVVHADSSSAAEHRYGATLMSPSFSPASEEPRVSVRTDHVRRRAYPWTPTVHALLRYLTENGFDKVPRPLGIEDGFETLSLIPGESGRAGWAKIVTETGLRAFARFLRDYHDATEGFEPQPTDAPWAFRSGAAPLGEVICHGDFGAWNVVWRGDEPVGLLDFDFAGPGDRMLDVAYALQYAAPFCDDEECVRWHSYPEPPDRRRRIEVFADAYGLATTEKLVDAVIERQELDILHVSTLAARGFEPQRTWVRGGTLEDLAARVRWSREHRSLFE